MRALVVGAMGSVGQVLGSALAEGGADVVAYARPHHRDALAAGVAVTRLDGGRRTRTWAPSQIATTHDDVAGRAYDLVVLAVPTPALAEVAPVLRATPEATVLLLQPGERVTSDVAAMIGGAERIVRGLVSFVAFPTPQAWCPDAPGTGTAVWFAPLAAIPLEGADGRAIAVLEVLRRGGLPATRMRGLDAQQELVAAVLQPAVAALEAAHWSIEALRRAAWVDLAAQAARQAVTIAAADRGETAPVWVRLLGRHAIQGVLQVAPSVVPFDLEAYLQLHFTKVGAQTRAWFDAQIARGHRLDRATDALEALRDALGAGHA